MTSTHPICLRHVVLLGLASAGLLLLACSGSPGQPAVSPTADGSALVRKAGTVERDVTYCSVDGIDLKMDVYYPSATDGRPAPVAVYVHGGGWVSGSKGGGAGRLDVGELVSRGYVVASVDYRLAPTYQFPAQIEDVKCAIRSLRAQAAEYGIDPDRIGAWGGSAGGHLVSLLGTTDARAGFDVGPYPEQSSRVRAVVDLFGPSDLTVFGMAIAMATSPPAIGTATAMATSAPAFGTVTAMVTGARVFGAASPDDLARASPVTYASGDDPPFLILQGEKDAVVPPNQSQILYDRLTAAGVRATLVMVKNAGHGFRPVGGPISPTRSELTMMSADFFDEHLR